MPIHIFNSIEYLWLYRLPNSPSSITAFKLGPKKPSRAKSNNSWTIRAHVWCGFPWGLSSQWIQYGKFDIMLWHFYRYNKYFIYIFFPFPVSCSGFVSAAHFRGDEFCLLPSQVALSLFLYVCLPLRYFTCVFSCETCSNLFHHKSPYNIESFFFLCSPS